eukprot:TRINITY_DN3729_c0_g2_i2.p1 TRINITY_DN3729_c0_g2~~TRINITY_DN3729_c0_g2_i2.p1  ORF type:complete len:221 (+),score=59.63 TRINITY_DN3729_c0_g2_i2:148-810(+)
MEISSDRKTISIKIALLGDSGVGKTSILQRYCYDTFDTEVPATEVASFKKSILYSSNKKTEVQLKIWDTAGQETYRSLAPFYCKDADAVMLVYDITNKESFDSLNYWLDKVHSFSSSNCLIIVVGNKSDCLNNEKVSQKAASDFGIANKLSVLIVSAKDNINIKRAFESIVAKKLPEFAAELGYEEYSEPDTSTKKGRESSRVQGRRLVKANGKRKNKCC